MPLKIFFADRSDVFVDDAVAPDFVNIPFFGPVPNDQIEFMEKLVIDTVQVARAWNRQKSSQEEL